MKIFLIVLIMILSIFVGFVFSKKYSNRNKFFQSLVSLCQKFDVEINYSRERVKNILENLDEKHKINLSGLDKNYISFIEKKNQLDKETLFKNISFLKESEEDMILLFFKSLGRSDVDSQSKEIKNYQKKFEDKLKETQTENKKYGTLSIKLGVIVGLFVVVLLL